MSEKINTPSIDQEPLDRNWLGCNVTIFAIAAVSIGIPTLIFTGDDTAALNKIIGGYLLFSSIGVALILLLLDAYFVQLNDLGIARGIFGRDKFLAWDQIQRVEIRMQFTFVGQNHSVLVFPFVFKDQAQFYTYIKNRLGERFVYAY